MWQPGKAAPSTQAKKAVNDKAKKDGPKAPKPTLSHKTLAMKFMQRKNQSALAKQVSQQDEWEDDDKNDENNTGIKCSRDVPDASVDRKLGRRSFGGFNTNVEDVQKELKTSKKFEEANAKALKDEISAEEMANRMMKYSGLRGNQRNANPRPSKRQKK